MSKTAVTRNSIFLTSQKLQIITLFPYTTLFRSPPTATKEIQYLNAKGALTYTDIAGDPVLYRSEKRFSRNAETDLVCRLLLEKKKKKRDHSRSTQSRNRAASPPETPG